MKTGNDMNENVFESYNEDQLDTDGEGEGSADNGGNGGFDNTELGQILSLKRLKFSNKFSLRSPCL